MNRQTAVEDQINEQREGQAAFAQQVLAAEAEAIRRLSIGAPFHAAVELILGTTGAVVVTGLGKSWLIGQKISATFASTGMPSLVLHPTDALHGDLGRVRRDDVVLALSYGGNTEEVVCLVTHLRQDDVPVISIVGSDESDLGRLSTIALCLGDVTEACPMNLAPTASTTATLAMGDALALCVSRRRQFGVEDFQKVHPGGALGRQLMAVVDAMRFRVGENLPLVHRDMTVGEAYRRADIEAPGVRRAGALLVVDGPGKLCGIFTDADLRRLMLRDGDRALGEPIHAVMTANPRRLGPGALVRDAVQLVRELRIDEIPVVDRENVPIGLIDVQDLITLKVIEG